MGRHARIAPSSAQRAGAGAGAGTGIGAPGFGVLSPAAAIASMLSSFVTEACEIAVTEEDGSALIAWNLR